MPVGSRVLLVSGVVAALGGATCSRPGDTVACRTNLECGAFRTCNTKTGHCRCADDRGCGQGEFCNQVFQCQVISGCTENADCDQHGADLVCNILTGTCGPREVCALDSQCALGRICDGQTGACMEACRDEADCVLGTGCQRDNPNSPLGTCRAGTCSATFQCGIGENCDLSTRGCVPDERGPFCGACASFNPLDPQCGDPANYCLIDTGDPARRGHYCGVDCSQEQGCPNGYECKDVIIVGPPATPACNVEACTNGVCTLSGTACSAPQDCPMGPPGGDCARAHDGVCAGTVSQACASDADCGGSAGSCRFAECRLRERSAYGFCACVVDSDCPADDCRGADLTDPGNPVPGRCLLSGHRCYTPDECNVIACVNGGCLIGRNCKPGNDRRCIDFQVTPEP